MTFQRTLNGVISLDGIGLHSGRPARLTLRPGLPNSGVKFVRTDLPGNPEIAARYSNVINTQLATTLGDGRITVSTVEHVLAALQGMQIDNAVIDVDGPEIPIMDGSSGPFCEAVYAAGVRLQKVFRPYLLLKRRVEVKVAEKWAIAEPADRLEIQASIDWDHPAIGYQEYHYVEGRSSFEDLANARTFGFLRDVENLKKMGLARGGSLDNAVVLDEGLVLNPEGLRFPDEFVRHKIVDALGDLKLAGVPIRAYFRLHRAGHDLHSQLVSAIFSSVDNYEIIRTDVSTDVSEELQPLLNRRKLVANAV